MGSKWLCTEQGGNHFLSRSALFLSSSFGPKAKKTKLAMKRGARFPKDSRIKFNFGAQKRAQIIDVLLFRTQNVPGPSEKKSTVTYLGSSIISRTELISTVGVTCILSISSPTSLARTTCEFFAWSENDLIYSFYSNMQFCTQFLPANQLHFKGVFISSWYFRHITKRLVAYSQKFPWEKAGLWLFSSIFGGWFFVVSKLLVNRFKLSLLWYAKGTSGRINSFAWLSRRERFTSKKGIFKCTEKAKTWPHLRESERLARTRGYLESNELYLQTTASESWVVRHRAIPEWNSIHREWWSRGIAVELQ